jgi:hypothetical protein
VLILIKIFVCPSKAILYCPGLNEAILICVDGEIIFDWSLLAISFVIILRTQFRREMDQKSFTLTGCLFWG